MRHRSLMSGFKSFDVHNYFDMTYLMRFYKAELLAAEIKSGKVFDAKTVLSKNKKKSKSRRK